MQRKGIQTHIHRDHSCTWKFASQVGLSGSPECSHSQRPHLHTPRSLQMPYKRE